MGRPFCITSTSDTPSHIRLFRPNLAFLSPPTAPQEQIQRRSFQLQIYRKNSEGVRNEGGTCRSLPKRRYFSPIGPINFFCRQIIMPFWCSADSNKRGSIVFSIAGNCDHNTHANEGPIPMLIVTLFFFMKELWLFEKKPNSPFK